MAAPRQVLVAARKAEREARLAAMRDGRRQRAAVFKPRKGKGAYRRRAKHKRVRD